MHSLYFFSVICLKRIRTEADTD